MDVRDLLKEPIVIRDEDGAVLEVLSLTDGGYPRFADASDEEAWHSEAETLQALTDRALSRQREQYEPVIRLKEQLEREYTETQEALATLAEALGFDWEMAWDHDSCPNNSECIAQLITVARTSNRETLEALRRARQHLNANFLHALPKRAMPLSAFTSSVAVAATEVAQAEDEIDTLIAALATLSESQPTKERIDG